MPIDPNIPLAVKTPEPISPLQTIGGLMQLRNAASEIALRNAQTTAAQQQAADLQAQAAIRNRDVADQNKLRDLMLDPANRQKFSNGDFSFASGQVSPTTYANFAKNGIDILEKSKALRATDAAFHAAGREQLASTFQGLDPNDDARAADQFNASIPILAQDHQELARQLSPQTPSSIRQYVKDQAASNQVAFLILQKQAEQEKTKSETTKNLAQAGQAKEEEGLAHVKAQREQAILDMIKQGKQAVQNGENPMRTVFPPSLDQQISDSYANAWDAAMKQPPDENGRHPAADALLSAAASHAASVQLPGNPKVIQGEADKARAIETATLPMKMQLELQKQVTLARTMMGTGPTKDVPAHLAPTAIHDYEKAGQEYVGALNAADEMKAMTDMARAGNKVAYSYIPTTGVLTINGTNGSHRVNLNEIQAYGGAGSIVDNLRGFFGKQTAGASIPANILTNIDELHGGLADVAKDTYARKVQVINGSYGSSFKPLDFGPVPGASPKPAGTAAPQFKVGDKVMYNGKQHTVTGINNGKLVLDGGQ